MPSFAAPHTWLAGLVSHLGHEVVGAEIASAISGPGWISLRLPHTFLWIVARGDLRLAWTDDAPISKTWLELLQRHRRSPFAAHLVGERIDAAGLLEDADGRADGMALRLGNGARLVARYWPRPGALWVEDADGEMLAQAGRMGGDPLRFATADAPFDPAPHAEGCRDALRAHLTARTARLLRQRLQQALARTERRIAKLEQEAHDARRDARARAEADLLAAHLHAVKPGQASVRLTDFEGNEVELELDPSLSPAANLQRRYKRAGRAERKELEVQGRLDDAKEQKAQQEESLRRAESLGASTLEEWLDFARSLDLDPAPTVAPPASERGRPDERRRPYWTFVVDGTWELRVGRNARDNDELTQRHSHGHDLWLHAQGVTGSHVVLRTSGKPVPAAVVEKAARVAAHYSKAKHSSTVAVQVCERRYVRKPRKAPPGMVAVERAKTLFVEPGMPTGVEKSD